MKKTRSLGPANDDIPKDEMLLAKIVQNAKARGFGVTWGPCYIDYNEQTRKVRGPNPCCCALGAALLEDDTSQHSGLSTGHENPDLWPRAWERDYFNAGVTFADAMGGQQTLINARYSSLHGGPRSGVRVSI